MNIGYIHLDYGNGLPEVITSKKSDWQKPWNKWDTKQRLCTGCLPKTGAAERK